MRYKIAVAWLHQSLNFFCEALRDGRIIFQVIHLLTLLHSNLFGSLLGEAKLGKKHDFTFFMILVTIGSLLGEAKKCDYQCSNSQIHHPSIERYPTSILVTSLVTIGSLLGEAKSGRLS